MTLGELMSRLAKLSAMNPAAASMPVIDPRGVEIVDVRATRGLGGQFPGRPVILLDDFNPDD